MALNLGVMTCCQGLNFCRNEQKMASSHRDCPLTDQVSIADNGNSSDARSPSNAGYLKGYGGMQQKKMTRGVQ